MTSPTPPSAASDLDKLAEMEKAATPGPWRVHLPSEETTYSDTVLGGEDGEDEVLDRGCHGRIQDLAFAAALRNAAPALLRAAREAERLREDVKDLREELYTAHIFEIMNHGVTQEDCDCRHCVAYRSALGSGEGEGGGR